MGNMQRESGCGVVLEVSLTSMSIKLSKGQLRRIRNHDGQSYNKADQELVSLAFAHSYRSHEYQAGDIYRRTSFGPRGQPLTLVLNGPTKVSHSQFP